MVVVVGEFVCEGEWLLLLLILLFAVDCCCCGWRTTTTNLGQRGLVGRLCIWGRGLGDGEWYRALVTAGLVRFDFAGVGWYCCWWCEGVRRRKAIGFVGDWDGPFIVHSMCVCYQRAIISCWRAAYEVVSSHQQVIERAAEVAVFLLLLLGRHFIRAKDEGKFLPFSSPVCPLLLFLPHSLLGGVQQQHC